MAYSNSEAVDHQEIIRKSELFIKADIDDFGLTPHQFRIVAHVSRRTDCWASIDTIASVCRMHPDTARRHIKRLAEMRVLCREERIGETLLLRVNPFYEWRKLDESSYQGPPGPSEWDVGKKGRGATRKLRETKVPQRRFSKKEIQRGSPCKSFELNEGSEETEALIQRLQAEHPPKNIRQILRKLVVYTNAKSQTAVSEKLISWVLNERDASLSGGQPVSVGFVDTKGGYESWKQN